MTVLVTGGSGFVGINIAAHLLQKGEAVVLFGPDAPPPTAKDFLNGLGGTLDIVLGDVRHRPALDAVIRDQHIRNIVHGAAITAGVQREATQAAQIAEVNLLGTLNVLEAALVGKVRRVVQLGTGSVFGRPPAVESIDEDLLPAPESLYGITKYAAERAALRYRETRGLDVVVARLGVVFGRWEYDTGVRDTLSLALQLVEIAERGEIARFRSGLPDDWVYATDIARAVEGLLAAPALPHGLYHLATGNRWSVTDWCERMKAEFPGFDYEQTEDAARLTVGQTTAPARPPFRIDRLRSDTGFEPAYGPAEAFADYRAWRRDTPPPRRPDQRAPDDGTLHDG